MSKKNNKKTRVGHRDARTGRFVTRQYAQTHPDTTVAQRLPLPEPAAVKPEETIQPRVLTQD